MYVPVHLLGVSSRLPFRDDWGIEFSLIGLGSRGPQGECTTLIFFI